MKFKEIKPGMVIHCPTEEDARALLEHLAVLNYKYGKRRTIREAIDDIPVRDNVVYYIYDNKILSWGIKQFICDNSEITEFSDLIEPEIDLICDENSDYSLSINGKTDFTDGKKIMSATEVLEWYTEADCSVLTEVFNGWSGIDDVLERFTSEEIVQRITAYEAGKKKPKPVEVEDGFWYEIYSTDHEWRAQDELWGYAFARAYETAKEKANDYVKQHGGECGIEMRYICRVKEDEA